MGASSLLSLVVGLLGLLAKHSENTLSLHKDEACVVNWGYASSCEQETQVLDVSVLSHTVTPLSVPPEKLLRQLIRTFSAHKIWAESWAKLFS